MYYLVKEILFEELVEAENAQRSESVEKRRKLVGYLAGDRKIVRGMTLDGIAEMFNTLSEIFEGIYDRESLINHRTLDTMEDFIPKNRRRAI